MKEHVSHKRHSATKIPFGIASRVRSFFIRLLPAELGLRLGGIGARLSLLVVALVTLLTFGTAFLVINIMDNVLLRSMLKRGAASVHAIASAAGYSILAEDRLALDNLVAQGKKAQDDIVYLVILDRSRKILAHNQLDLNGSILTPSAGQLIEREGSLRASLVEHQGEGVYEFSVPVEFAGRRVGEVVAGLSPQSLLNARTSARWRILFVCGLTVAGGIVGARWLTQRIIRPIRQLSQGVERLKLSPAPISVPVLAEDELGRLTEDFNRMAAELAAQRQNLIASSQELEKSYHDIVQILAGALDARDNYTYGHSARVAQLAVMLGKQLGLTNRQLKELEMACLLHDIGKIRVPDRILNKQAPLDRQESSRIRQHPAHGVEILALADSLRPYIPTVKHHHERFDGQGYPDGLCGEQIPLYAQIVALTDTYDAMTSSRPYREGLPVETALKEIQRFRGSQFSPELTDKFVSILRNFPDAQPAGGRM